MDAVDGDDDGGGGNEGVAVDWRRAARAANAKTAEDGAVMFATRLLEIILKKISMTRRIGEKKKIQY